MGDGKSRVNGEQLISIFVRVACHLPYIRYLFSGNGIILLYHGVPKNSEDGSIDSRVFEAHVNFIRQRFNVVSAAGLLERRAKDKIKVMLTFDDGFRNNAETVAPILTKYNMPATFFVCSRHSVPGKYLWFSYLRALRKYFPEKRLTFRGAILDMSSDSRNVSVSKLSDHLLNLKPHPGAMYKAIEEELPRLEDFVNAETLRDSYAGASAQEVRQLAANPLFSVGAHTVDHPFLPKCDSGEVNRQFTENKKWIEAVTSRPCNSIAYPSGAYDSGVLEQARGAGFAYGHAVIPVLKRDVQYELPRLGIYSKSLDILAFKVYWGNLLRAVPLKVG